MKPLTTASPPDRERIAEAAFVGSCAVYLLGLLLNARAIASLAPLALLLAGAVQPGARSRLRLIRYNGPALMLMAIYPMLLVSGLWSEDLKEWRHVVTRYLPFLAVPLAFCMARPLTTRQRYGLGLLFVMATTAVALGTVIQFLLNYQTESDRISRSQNITAITGVFHIHFGIMIGLASFFAWALARAAAAYGQPWRARLLRATAVGLALALHLLAYRTGLLVFYALIVVIAIRTLVLERRYAVGVLLLLLLILAPALAYMTLEPVMRRVENTRYDLNRFLNGEDINHYSLAQRLAAWTNAATLIRQHWAIGVGPADIPLEMERQYERRSFGLAPENRVLLHNQYLFALLSLGVVGLAWLLGLLFVPLTHRAVRQDFCAVVFLCGIAAAMLVDTPFSLHIGLHLFLSLYALLLVGPRHRELLATASPSRSQPATEQLGIAGTLPFLCQPTPQSGPFPV